MNTIFKHLVLLLKIMLFFSITLSYAQIVPKNTNKNPFKGSIYERIQTRFIKPTIEIEESGLVSNVLQIVNTSNDNLNFTVDVLIPTKWKSIIDKNKVYNLALKDTLVIPVLLVPSKLTEKAGQIIINTFVVDIDGQQIGDNSFLLKTKKKIDWELRLDDNNTYYFKNGETKKKFQYSITNTGNYKQAFAIDYKIPRKNLYLSDTTLLEKKLLKNYHSITLSQKETASFSYYVHPILQNKRNQKRISNQDYTPYNNELYKKYDFVVKTREDRSSNNAYKRKSKKVSFIQLPNAEQMEAYSFPNLPLIVDAYIQDVLGENPFMAINLRGLKKLNNDAQLVYNTNLNFSGNYFNKDLLNDLPWYVGYYDNRKSIELGQIGSGMIGIGTYRRGVRVSYTLDSENRFSGFFSNSNNNTVNSINNRSYGVTYDYGTSFFKLQTQVGRNENNILGRFNNIISVRPSFRFFKKYAMSFRLVQSTSTTQGVSDKITGYLYQTSFNANFSEYLNTNFNASYIAPEFNNSGSSTINANHNTSYRYNWKYSVNLSNNLQRTKRNLFSGNSNNYANTSLNNRLNISTSTSYGNTSRGLYYDYRRFLGVEVVSRGISYNISKANYSKNLISAFNFRTGYSKQLLDIETENEFSFNFTTLVRYKVWNFNLMYTLGNYSVNPFQRNDGFNTNPQSIRTTVQNQYSFKNRRLVLETNANYTYRNIASNNSFGITPTLFYFSKTNWRYSLLLNYSYNSSDYRFLNDDNSDDYFAFNNGKTESSNFRIGIGLRKEFGIRLPFAKPTTTDALFVAFKDANGNGIKDSGEIVLNNVVIELGTKEVITKPNGTALIKHASRKKMKLEVLALEEELGWFPETRDSIIIGEERIYYLPFYKGVNLYGDVILDRQKIAITDEKPFDLSRIRIVASKNNKTYTTLTDNSGHFEFCLPPGNYTLTMDEGILSTNLRLPKNNIPIVLSNNQDGTYMSFYILEKRRKVIIRDFSKKKR